MGLSNKSPCNNEIEVSIFGPGYGECILIHVGNNIWLVIDSCLDPIENIPYPLSYLSKLGLNPQECIKHIFATHWHNDHICGLSHILETCIDASFTCSSAIGTKEFVNLVSAYKNYSMMRENGLEEFSKILQLIDERNTTDIKLASSDKHLFKIENPSQSSLDCNIYSLSPSDRAIRMAYVDIAKLFPEEITTKKSLPGLQPNHTSVVILITIGNLCLLLGADLEEIGDDRTGWAKIISSATRQKQKANLYKIAHHGSRNGEHPDIWTELLHASFNSVLTPFTLGSVYLPKISDLKRIQEKTESNPVYITSLPKWKRPNTREKAVERTIRESGIKLMKPNRSHGQVRFRIDPNISTTDWKVELDGEATNIENLI